MPVFFQAESLKSTERKDFSGIWIHLREISKQILYDFNCYVAKNTLIN